MKFPVFIIESLKKAHPSWHSVLEKAIYDVATRNSNYFSELEKSNFLPTKNRLFSAFSQPMQKVRYVLVGEGPYPREDSATGYCFMDGAVQNIWSEKGFSKQVNRATSLRNFLKMLLVAENTLQSSDTSGNAVSRIVLEKQGENFPYITQLNELQKALLDNGFLLLNATLVFRKNVLPVKEASAWMPFLQTIFDSLANHAIEFKKPFPTLVLWGKIAERLSKIESVSLFSQVYSEHPYNLSFIQNQKMQDLFGKMKLLKINNKQ